MFKDILNKDLDIFLNLEEFGEQVYINGVAIEIVEDNEAAKEYKKQHLELFYNDIVLFYCRVEDLDRINISNYIEYKEYAWDIVSKDKQNDLYQVVLKRSTQGTIKEWF